MKKVSQVPARGDEPEHPSDVDSLYEETLALACAPLDLDDDPVEERAPERSTVFNVRAPRRST